MVYYYEGDLSSPVIQCQAALKKYIYIFKRLLITTLLSFASLNGYAKVVKVCNATPVIFDLAVGYNDGLGQRTRGWYGIKPGECSTWGGVEGNYFYYYAESYNALAKWINDGSHIQWSGGIVFNRKCVHESNAFEFRENDYCQKKYSFKKIRLPYSTNIIPIYEDNHKGIALSDAKEFYKTFYSIKIYDRKIAIICIIT